MAIGNAGIVNSLELPNNMADPFDPYVAWLGVSDPNRPPNHYQLLGLTNGEPDIAKVRAQADAVITKLNALDPGDSRADWNRLRQELTFAKLCLCDPVRKRSYDEQFRNVTAEATTAAAKSFPSQADLLPPGMAAAPSRPEPVVTPQPAQPAFAFAAAPTIETAAPTINLLGLAPAVENESPVSVSTINPQPEATANRPVIVTRPVSTNAPASAGPAVTAGSTSYHKSRKSLASPDTLMLAGAGVFVAALIYVGVSRMLGTPAAVPLATPNREIAQVIDKPDDPAPVATPPVKRPLEPTQTQAKTKPKPADSHSPNVAPAEPKPTIDKSVPPAATESNSPAEPAPITKVPEPTESPQPPTEAPKTAPEPKPPTDMPDKVAMKESPEKTAPAEPNPPQPPAAQPENADNSAAFDEAANGLRMALSERNLPQAKAQLAKVMSLAATQEQSQLAARLELLYNYVEGFWQAVVKSLEGVQATDVISVGNTEVAIVEVDQESLTIRASGRNLTYTLKNMPYEFAVLLAQRWFEKGAASNNLYLGAFLAVEPKADKREAKRYWEDATRGGASAEDLMPLLDLPRARKIVANKDAEPLSRTQVTKARQALRAQYVREFKAAITPDQKRQLCMELLEMAEQAEDRLTQCAMLEETLPLAIQAHAADEVKAAVEAIADFHQMNVWDLMAASLDKAASSTRVTPDEAKRLADVAVNQAEQALKAEQPAAAKSLVYTAVTTAKKAKDLPLLQRAQELKSQLPE